MRRSRSASNRARSSGVISGRGLVSRIDLPGAPTWRSTGAGLLYGVFPDPAPQAEVPAPPLAEQPVARIEAAVKAAVDAAVEATHQVGGEPSTSAPASADAPVDDAWRGWATRWLRYAYDDGRLDSEEIAERLDEVQRATSLRGLDAALHGLVRVPVVEAAERAAETEG